MRTNYSCCTGPEGTNDVQTAHFISSKHFAVTLYAFVYHAYKLWPVWNT